MNEKLPKPKRRGPTAYYLHRMEGSITIRVPQWLLERINLETQPNETVSQHVRTILIEHYPKYPPTE